MKQPSGMQGASAQQSQPAQPRPSVYARRPGSMRSAVTANALQTRPPSLSNLAELKELRDLKLNTEMQELALRDVNAISYVSRRRMDAADFDPDEVDEDGLPLVYNEERIAQFWSKRPGELASRWGNFAAISTPWLTKLANAFISGRLEERQGALARDAVENLEKLGPTFIKLGELYTVVNRVL
jgi:aarF domain-containing kinase